MINKLIILTILYFTIIQSANAQWVITSGPSEPLVTALVANDSIMIAGCSSASTNQGGHRTFNNGNSWGVVGSSLISKFRSVAINPSNGIIYAGGLTVFYQSYDNGTTFTNTSSGLGSSTIYDIIVDGANIYASGNGLYLTTNGGFNWTLISPVSPFINSYKMDKIGSTILLGTLNAGVYLSVNNGTSWNNPTTGLPSLINDVKIVNNNFLAASSSGVYISTNSGNTWNLTNLTLPVECIHQVGSVLFAGCSSGGGIYYSTDGGNIWIASNAGLTNTTVYSLASNSNYIFAGTNGYVFRRNLSDYNLCNGSLSSSIQNTAPTCGLSNGTITGSASGGSGSYNYLWSNGATTATVSNLSAGTYTLTVTDNTGCTASSSATVNNSICPKVTTQSTINNITQNSATVSWPAVSCAAKYRVIIKNVSTAVQTTTIVASPATSLNLINLQPNTTYQVRIRTQCSQNGTVLSQTSPITSFTTLNSQGIQCLPPTNISSAPIGASSVQVSWTAAAGVTQYNLRYRIVGNGTWITNTINASLTDITLINLTPASTYEFQMRTKCNNNPSEFSPYSTLYNFYSGSSGTTLHSCGPDSVHNSQLSYGLLTDQQGNNYKTILIGSQEWMAENLYSSIYRNGDPINNITGNTQWQNATSGAWCHFNNNSQFECPYGKLYNWYAVADSRNLCPTGWHIPTDTEWNILIQHLDSMYSPNATASQSDSAGGKIKTSGFAFWSPSTDTSSNSSGFSGLPAGNRSSIGVFSNLYAYANWWSASVNVDNSWYRSVRYFNNDIYRFSSNRSSGFSVRCLKDQSSGNRIHHNESLQRFNLYPNPTKHSINLIINSPTETTATITISDILGRVLQKETEELINGTNTITYNISAFAAGVYLVHVGNGNTQQVFKLVKE